MTDVTSKPTRSRGAVSVAYTTDVPPDMIAEAREIEAARSLSAATPDLRIASGETPADALRRVLADALAADPAASGKPFTTLMLVEGMETSDGRMMELGTTTWRDLPIPLMVQDTSPHGPGQVPAPAWIAGQITEIVRDEDAARIVGRGALLPGEAGARAEEIVRHGFRGVSIDGYGDGLLPPVEQPVAVDQDGHPISVLVRFNDTVITRLTLVPTPAFECACLWFDDEDMPPIAADAHGSFIDPDAEPEVVEVPVPVNAYELLVASAADYPVNPPKAAFFQRPAPERQEVILDPQTGFISGHLFGVDECHIANPGFCDRAPISHTVPPFLGFHRTEAICADGSRVACGWIPVNTNHSRISNGRREAEQWSQDETWEHYENSGTLIAKVRASNTPQGVWLSGCLLPGLADRELAIAQGLSVSGHWNVFTDPRSGQRFPDELLAVLGGVPFPGYPETRVRPELLVASGQVVAQIGPFGGCDDECEDCEGDAMSAADVAELGRLGRIVSVLFDAAPEDVRAAALASVGVAPAEAALEVQVGDNPPTTLSANEGIWIEEGAPVVALSEDEWAERAGEQADRLCTLSVGGMTITGKGLVVTATEPAAFDPTVPLSVAEAARWYGKYDAKARAKMTADGQALRDGSCGIGDAEDLAWAVRAAANLGFAPTAMLVTHIQRNAERLGTPDIAASLA